MRGSLLQGDTYSCTTYCGSVQMVYEMIHVTVMVDAETLISQLWSGI